MEVYKVKYGDIAAKCDYCRWEFDSLYYTDWNEVRYDLERVAGGEVPEYGLCPTCLVERYLKTLEITAGGQS